jgi:RNA polymerase sigma factor (sigma-70 family)
MRNAPTRTNEPGEPDWDVLAARFRAGDSAATEDLFRQLRPLVLTWVLDWARRSNSLRQDPDDIVQKVLVQLFERGLYFDPARGRFLSYVHALTRNTLVDEARKSAAVQRPVSFTDAGLFRDLPQILFSAETEDDEVEDLPDPSELVEQNTRRRRRRSRRHKKRRVKFLSLDDLDLADELPDHRPRAETLAMAAQDCSRVQAAVRDALARLTEKTRRAVTLRLLEGRTTAEIAKELVPRLGPPVG